MLHAVAKNWWVLLVRGIGAILFSIVAFAWPGLTLMLLVVLYGVHALLDGVTAVMFGLTHRETGTSWGAMVLVGVFSILAGLIALFYPGITEFVLLIVIASWCIVRGIFEIAAAIRLRTVIDNEWMLGLSGATSILIGILLLAWPAAGLMTIVYLIGAAAMAIGIFLVILAMRLRTVWQRVKGAAPPPGALPT